MNTLGRNSEWHWLQSERRLREIVHVSPGMQQIPSVGFCEFVKVWGGWTASVLLFIQTNPDKMFKIN